MNPSLCPICRTPHPTIEQAVLCCIEDEKPALDHLQFVEESVKDFCKVHDSEHIVQKSIQNLLDYALLLEQLLNRGKMDSSVLRLGAAKVVFSASCLTYVFPGLAKIDRELEEYAEDVH